MVLAVVELEEVVGHGFGGDGHLATHPPVDGFGKAANQMVEQKTFGDVKGEVGQVLIKEGFEVGFKVAQEAFAAIGEEDAAEVVAAVSDMPEDVGEFGFQKSVVADPWTGVIFEDVMKEIIAHCFQKMVFGGEVCVEGASANVGFFQNLLHGDVVIAFGFQKLTKGSKDCFPGFDLAAIHRISRTIRSEMFGYEHFWGVCLLCFSIKLFTLLPNTLFDNAYYTSFQPLIERFCTMPILSFLASLSGIRYTMISGVCLVIDFLPVLAEWLKRPLPAFCTLPFSAAWGAVLISGTPLILLAGRRLWCNRGIKRISSALLISIAMVAAIAIGDLFAAGEVAFIMAIGEWLEDRTIARARQGLAALIRLTPQRGRRLEDGNEVEIPVEAIEKGDLLRVLPGETIPVDGVILSGETTVNQAIITGESLPVERIPGQSVFCGTLNCFGAIDIRAAGVGADTSLQKLIRMVQEAETKQAPIQRIADRWASLLVPVALVIAILAGILTADVTVAVTILVVFCPCALVLATPTAIMAAIGQATQHGVIIKSGEALEQMSAVTTLAFDKTGTLTLGKPTVAVVHPETLEPTAFLTVVAAAERQSEHPLATAIVTSAREQGCALPEPEAFQVEAGQGICARIHGQTVRCGSVRYFQQQQIALPAAAEQVLERCQTAGQATVLVAIDQQYAGLIALEDTLRPDVPQVIQQLKELGLMPLLLTGDHQAAATTIAQRAGITEVCAELLPETKVDRVQQRQANGEVLCMIGDGINDAPALKTATVGIAMGVMGSDIAVEAADIALMRDDLSRLVYLKRLADATTATIRLSITLSLLVNTVAILLSIFKLLTPTTGALVHNAGSCFVILIAALLYSRRFD